jgi:uncharacterized protein YbbC (DUF1343 family)
VLKSTLLLLIVSTFQFHHVYSKTILGIDKLENENFKLLKGKNIALVCNIASRNGVGKETFDIFKERTNFKLLKVFTPEHGYFGKIKAGEKVSDSKYKSIDFISLYGDNRKPTKNQLQGISTIVIDLQDIGIRSYTYISTMYKCLEAAADNDKEVIILDRPNPLGGLLIDGNNVEKDFFSFVSIADIPYLHGLTIGELALYFKKYSPIKNAQKLKLKVVSMDNWKRTYTWSDTKLTFYPTSPNIPDINSIYGCAMLGAIGELGFLKIGIGTSKPFQTITIDNGSFYNNAGFIKELKSNGIEVIKSENTYTFYFNMPKVKSLYSMGLKLLKIETSAGLTIPEKKSLFNQVCGTNKVINCLKSSACSINNLEQLLNNGIADFKSKRKTILLYK